MAWPRPAWFDTRDESLGRRAALAPLVPVAWLYGLGARIARRANGPRSSRGMRLSCRVVSVGNLVVGGSGKTPTTAWIAAHLRSRGHRVAIASRGYGRRGTDPVRVVSDGRHVHSGIVESGDEPLLLAAHAPGVPVLVGPDRAVVGLRAISAFGIDVLVLDDGLQHFHLARDVEVVTVDGGAGIGNGRVLPRGPLREPLSVLRLADAIVVVDGPLPEREREQFESRAPLARWFDARRKPQGVRALSGGPVSAPESLAGLEVGILAGIAQPASLRRTLEGLGATVVVERTRPDHHHYRPRDLAGLSARAPIWVTTEKDAVKILPSWVEGVDLRVLRVALEVDRQDELLTWLDDALSAARRYASA